MNKKLLLFAFCFIFSSQIFAQDVPEQQKTLLTKATATWCTFCGGWGWSFFEGLIEDDEEKAVLIAAHHSSQLATSTSEWFADNFNNTSQPRFYLNNENQGVSPNNSDDKRIAIQDSVNANFDSAPVVNAGIEVFVTDLFEINVKTKFFQAAEGEYYLGLYFVENDLVNFQQSIGNDAVHQKVIRDAITDEIFGELIVNGQVDAGTENEFTFQVEPDWGAAELEVIAIIWKKDGDAYVVENVNMQDQFTLVSTNDLSLSEAKMTIQPNVILDQATIHIQVEQNLENVNLSLFDIYGKKVTDIFQGNLPTGDHNFSLEKNNDLSGGMYFVNLQANGKVTTQKVVFR